MKFLFYIGVLISIFSCKKEDIHTIQKDVLKGKLKSIEYDTYKIIINYDSLSGEIKDTKTPSGIDTLIGYEFSNENDKVLIYEYQFSNIVVTYIAHKKGVTKQIKSIKRLDTTVMLEFPYFKIDYTDQINSISEPGLGPFLSNLEDYGYMFDGNNYSKFIIEYDYGYPVSSHVIDTITLTYTDLPFNKYAPMQNMYSTFNVLDIPFFLGFDDYYMYLPNKNLIATSHHTYGNYTINYEYKFNLLNQLTNVIIDHNSGHIEYNLDYY